MPIQAFILKKLILKQNKSQNKPQYLLFSGWKISHKFHRYPFFFFDLRQKYQTLILISYTWLNFVRGTTPDKLLQDFWTSSLTRKFDSSTERRPKHKKLDSMKTNWKFDNIFYFKHWFSHKNGSKFSLMPLFIHSYIELCCF